MASFRSEAEAFSGIPGMAEGHARYGRGLKPWVLAQEVGSFTRGRILVYSNNNDLMVAQDISLIYKGSRERVAALKDFSVGISVGEFVSVLGPSGCGKTTFLKLACGLLRPTSGRITLDGTPIDGPRRDVGVVFQQPTLLNWKTVIDNVLLPAKVLGIGKNESRTKAMELLKLTGLEQFANYYPTELSGGMQQRVGLARGLIHDPRVVLMDEPFGALDAMTREYMALELQHIWMATHKSIIFITHSIPEAVFLSDRVVILSERPGRVVEEVTVEIPRPRGIDTMADKEFSHLCNRLRNVFGSIEKAR
jgi:NitT/TauT family transport system ATP-binding protein